MKTAPAPQPTGDTQERSQRTQRMLDAYADERQEQSATRQKKQTERKERQQRCQEAKTRQLEYAAASYIYVTDAQGNRRIVDDTERGRMQTDADAAVAKWCR